VLRDIPIACASCRIDSPRFALTRISTTSSWFNIAAQKPLSIPQVGQFHFAERVNLQLPITFAKRPFGGLLERRMSSIPR